MKLNEAEMRMAYQIEATSQNAALNEIYMTWRYTQNQEAEARQQSGAAKMVGHDIMALENQDKGFIKIKNHAKVRSGNLRYDHRDREL